MFSNHVKRHGTGHKKYPILDADLLSSFMKTFRKILCSLLITALLSPDLAHAMEEYDKGGTPASSLTIATGDVVIESRPAASPALVIGASGNRRAQEAQGKEQRVASPSSSYNSCPSLGSFQHEAYPLDRLESRGSIQVNDEYAPLLGQKVDEQVRRDFYDVVDEEAIGRLEEARIPFSKLKRLMVSRLVQTDKSSLPSTSVVSLSREDYKQKILGLAHQIQGTPLDEFGQYMGGHVFRGKLFRFLPRQFLLAIPVSLAMAAGTSFAMSPIVEWSLYNSKLDSFLGGSSSFELYFSFYINASVGLLTLADSADFMSELTSSGMGSFSMRNSGREKMMDFILIPLATIPGAFLLLLHWQIQQEHVKATKTKAFWNGYTEYFFYTSIGFLPYLTFKTWIMMRSAIRKMFHGDVPFHVQGRVKSLQYLEGQAEKHLTDLEIHELYTLMQGGGEKGLGKIVSAWADHFFKGKSSPFKTAEGLLTYLALSKVASEKYKSALNQGQEEDEGHKISRTTKIAAGLGLPAGFLLITGSVYGVVSSFLDDIPSLTIALSAGFITFIIAGILQKHGLEETLEMIDESVTPYLRGQKSALDVLCDPIKLGKAFGKAVAYAFGFFQNLLTNLGPIGVTLGVFIPALLGGSEETQLIVGGCLLGLGIPYMINELITGPFDIMRQVVMIGQFTQSVVRKVYDFVTWSRKISPSREREWVRKKLREAIGVTLTFTPDFEQSLQKLD